GVLDRLDAAESPARAAFGLHGVDARLRVARGFHVEMEGELVLQIALDPPPQEQRSQAQRHDEDPFPPRHGYTSFSRTTRVIAEEIRFQFSASSSRCSRPRRVSE